MSDGLTVSEISLLNDLKHLQAISHNLANVNTSGYKQQVVRVKGFDDVIDAANSDQKGARKEGIVVMQKPEVESVVDASAGALKYTGNPLDVSLADNVYFCVKSQYGEVLTRQGDLHLDARGRLVNSSGLPIIGVSGEVRLTTDKPVINQQGEIYIDEKPVEQLKLVRISNTGFLSSLGNGLYISTDQKKLVSKENVLHQGYIEASNVNMTDQMVKMIELTRHFESSQRVIRGYDQMLDSAINIIGDL